jgi:dihydrofolate reductase (trimethoprim resistance protein)
MTEKYQDWNEPKFCIGARVKKKSGGSWRGRICGWYSTRLTPEGYAVESAFEPNSVQIYPASALESWDGN